MKISTRNDIKGKVSEVKEDVVMANLKVDMGGGHHLTSLITFEPVKDLGLRAGD